MHRNKSVDVHRFAQVPRADIPRSAFRMQHGLKTTFNSGFLIPVCCIEVLPGDSMKVKATFFARLATPLVPVMDNIYLESFFFFVPNRLVWSNWVKFCGEQDNPSDSISFNIPQVVSPAGGWPLGSLYDYLGLPTTGQLTGTPGTISVNALPMRAYQLIFDEWFRDENLQNSQLPGIGDGPDVNNLSLQKRGKRHDYFTSGLPFLQKGTPVSLPLGASAPVRTSVADQVTGVQTNLRMLNATTGNSPTAGVNLGFGSSGQVGHGSAGAAMTNSVYPSNLYADLSTATAATINQIRQAFQIQRLLERDARGGTRYTEILFSHFGVKSPDARLQRPEYLGGGSTPISINPVAQTSNTPVTGTPQGNLAAFGTGLAQHGCSQSFVEHGFLIGIISVRADLTYQQGLHKMWSRLTRYDFYWPAFAMLGEQAIANKEIFVVGTPAQDDGVFAYQERWAEYRYLPSRITNLFKSTAAGTLEVWHLAQKFTTLPLLNATFISETPPIGRVIATPTEPEFKLDAFFDIFAARPLPLYSVPGEVDHF